MPVMQQQLLTQLLVTRLFTLGAKVRFSNPDCFTTLEAMMTYTCMCVHTVCTLFVENKFTLES